MGSGRQKIYETLCNLNPFVRNGLFLLVASGLVLGSGMMLWWFIQFLFPVIETTLSFVSAGIMWLVWVVACLISILYLSLLFQGK